MKNSELWRKFRKTEIFIGRGGAQCNSNGLRFDCRAPTPGSYLGNRAWGTRFLKD
jgi:hypothetical protein